MEADKEETVYRSAGAALAALDERQFPRARACMRRRRECLVCPPPLLPVPPLCWPPPRCDEVKKRV